MVTKRRTSGPGLARPKTPARPVPGSGPGRPPLYHDGLPDAAYKLALLGLVEEQIAAVFGVAVDTLQAWQDEYPDFAEAIFRGKTPADAEVAHGLFRRAVGYSHRAEKIFHHEGQITRASYTEQYAPDTHAAKLWLTNRQGQRWRERIEHAGDPTQPVVFQIIRADTKRSGT